MGKKPKKPFKTDFFWIIFFKTIRYLLRIVTGFLMPIHSFLLAEFVQIKIQLEDIHARLAEDAQLP